MPSKRGGEAGGRRENLKKLRGMVARFQNRGYATLARVADHLDELAVGDESNAAIDAVDAVSLMTVHAAKGLEFPSCSSSTSAADRRGLGRRSACHRRGEPSVAIADYQSEADEDALGREREETKRLLRGADTRARSAVFVGHGPGRHLQAGPGQPGGGDAGDAEGDVRSSRRVRGDLARRRSATLTLRFKISEFRFKIAD